MPGSHVHGLRILDDEKYLWCAVDIISRESTPYRKKNFTVNRRDTCHFPFLHSLPTPLHIQMRIDVAFVMAFHI